MRLTISLILTLLVALPTLALAGEEEAAAAQSDEAAAAKTKTYAPASDFTLPSIGGENVSLSDTLGEKVIVLSFWATWCAPCLKEMPKLVETQQRFGDKVKVFWISVDDAKDELKVSGIMRRFDLPGDQVLKDFERKVVSAYHKRGAPPFTVVIDKNKLKVLEKLGYTDGDEKKINEKVQDSL